jgi:hypothetical protein
VSKGTLAEGRWLPLTALVGVRRALGGVPVFLAEAEQGAVQPAGALAREFKPCGLRTRKCKSCPNTAPLAGF